MANYPTAPGRRMGTNRDGTIGVRSTDGWPTGGGPLTELTAAQMDTMSAEDFGPGAGAGPNSSNSGGTFVAYIFPELRDIDGWYASLDDGGTWANPTYVSANTTNASDGTWASSGSNNYIAGQSPVYRQQIVTIASNGIRGMRFKVSGASGGGGEMNILHIYGEIAAGETPDRLLFIDEATSLEFVLPIDYEEKPRGSAEVRQFRLKNNSTVAGNNLTINTIGISMEDQYLDSADWYLLSLNGDSYASSKAIASLAPEASSQLFDLKRTTPINEVLDAHAARIKATVVSVS